MLRRCPLYDYQVHATVLKNLPACAVDKEILNRKAVPFLTLVGNIEKKDMLLSRRKTHISS
jgi:hypothetical protein